MKIIDGHCDVLYKMYENSALSFYDPRTTGLDVTYERMLKSGVKVQFFAIYLPERITQPHFDHYLEYIRIFYQKIVQDERFIVIRTQADLDRVMNGDRLGAVLTLEGADALHGNLLHTQMLYYLGVRAIGITWNYANWAADGVLEPRQGGFTKRGKSFIKDCNELGILLDVSHLSVRAFWDLAAASTKPFVASHSNARAVCNHPRNLDDDQLREIIMRGGRIGLTFVPWFVQSGGMVKSEALLRHIEHICGLGGSHCITLGSDFDGIDKWLVGLEHAGQYGAFAELLSKHYKNELVEGILCGNWYRFLQSQLPLH
ncbi:dipeptidase [Paenibacillus sp. GD4]|jgi:membrane dipeptidase|uniref:dipeptidase n=1 Tax=Paenibacillus sp. GD4 TaxID=3068890 RepID=UPI00279668B9|nr:dipeptidase [Paenibacillus sp. GD4]MDQ1908915.1 dipeptidase [Paenibacillus sp. GD4]